MVVGGPVSDTSVVPAGTVVYDVAETSAGVTVLVIVTRNVEGVPVAQF